MSTLDDKKQNLIDESKGELELSDHIKLQVKDNENIQEQKIVGSDDSPHSNDKNLLESMGFPRNLIDRIYSVMHPVNIEEALDYLNKNDKDKFTHSYLEDQSHLCSICGCKRSEHAIDDIINAPIAKNEVKNDSNIDLDDYIIKNIKVDSDDDKDNDKDKDNKNNNNNYDDIDDDFISMFDKYRNVFKDKGDPISLNYSGQTRECGVCGDTIEGNDIAKIQLSCKHYFCVDCWKEYLKEKITNANVYKLSCMQNKCNLILQEKFIKDILGDDKDLKDKYDKFLNSKKLLGKKNIKFCPFPDCDGYAEKKFKKYVKCNFGHEFCFDCGAAPHGIKPCSKIIDKGFEDWKAHTLVKRCPNCKFWTEKNEGCNHMTCSQCKFQWCWVCEKECVAGHYAFGPCKGLHFEKVNNEEDAKRLMRENCDFCCIIGWLITNLVYIIIYFTMMPCFYLAVLGFRYLGEYDGCAQIVFYCMSFLPFFICYEILFSCYIAAATVLSIFVWPLQQPLKNMLFGKILGELFPV